MGYKEEIKIKKEEKMSKADKKAPLFNMDKKKVDYFIGSAEPLSEEVKVELENSLKEKEQRNQTIWEDNIERKLSATEGYNKEISNNLNIPELDEFDLVGNYILVRPWKIEVIEKTKSGIVLMSKTQEHYTDERTNKEKVREMVLPFQTKGIIVKYGDAVTEDFKTKYPIGSLIGIMTQPLHPLMFYVNKNDECTFPDPEKYLTLRLPVSHIERLYKVNKYTQNAI